MGRKFAFGLMALLSLPALGGCAHVPFGTELTERECLARAMYFESLRSSDEGMLAVGTTVMNRVSKPGYPKTICGVVGQPHQYAPGALTSPMTSRKGLARALRMADEVLSGARHPQVGGAIYFHTVGWVPPFHNMRYVAVAGGNAFYEKVAPQYRTFVPQSSFQRPEPVFRPMPQPVPMVAVASRRTPRSIDDLLGSSTSGQAGSPRVKVAKVAPMEIHPFTD